MRVRTVAIGDVIDTRYALLDKPVANDPVIISENKEIENRMGLIRQLQATLSIGDLTLKAVEQRNNIYPSIYRKDKLILRDFRFDCELLPNPKAMTEGLNSMGVKLMCSIWPQVDSRSENYHEM